MNLEVPHPISSVLLRSLIPSLLLCTSAFAWRSALCPAEWQPPTSTRSFESDAFLQDFSQAGYRRGESLPSEYLGPVIRPKLTAAQIAGQEDCTVAIQEALDQASRSGGALVPLPEGLLRVSVPKGKRAALHIHGSGVLLKGAGRDKTRILNSTTEMRRRCVLLVASDREQQGPEWEIPLSQDILGPGSALRLASPLPCKIGDWVEVTATLTDDWIREVGEPGWLERKPGDAFSYLRRVQSVSEDGREVVLDVPLRFSLKTRDQARLRPAPAMIEGCGIEGLSIASEPIQGEGWAEADWNKEGTAAWHADRSQLLELRGARDCWVRQVGSFSPPKAPGGIHQHSNGLHLDHCNSITLQQLFFSSPQYGGANGNGYMYRLTGSQDCLLEDCVSETCRHGFVFSGFGSHGNVLLRCKDLRSGRQLGDGKGEPAKTAGWGSDHHMWLSHSNLMDCCEVEESCLVAMYRPHSNHFLTASHSIFWNTKGTRPLRGQAVISQQLYQGYVIGTRGPNPEVGTVSVTKKGIQQTDPVDHVEGVGEGDTLEPFSLYEFQRTRRMKR